jgi:hypothetical protein
MTSQFELFATRIRFYFYYAILGAVGARELSSEYDYIDDIVDDYSHVGSHTTHSEIPIRHCYVVC